jgi:hypothetical protein
VFLFILFSRVRMNLNGVLDWRLNLLTTFLSMVFPDHSGPRPLIQFLNHFLIDGRTRWTSDQLIARLAKHRTTQTQNKRIHTPNIHALSEILTHDPSDRASEDSSCLRPRGHCDRPASERAQTVHALNRASTVSGIS